MKIRFFIIRLKYLTTIVVCNPFSTYLLTIFSLMAVPVEHSCCLPVVHHPRHPYKVEIDEVAVGTLDPMFQQRYHNALQSLRRLVQDCSHQGHYPTPSGYCLLSHPGFDCDGAVSCLPVTLSLSQNLLGKRNSYRFCAHPPLHLVRLPRGMLAGVACYLRPATKWYKEKKKTR